MLQLIHCKSHEVSPLVPGWTCILLKSAQVANTAGNCTILKLCGLKVQLQLSVKESKEFKKQDTAHWVLKCFLDVKH